MVTLVGPSNSRQLSRGGSSSRENPASVRNEELDSPRKSTSADLIKYLRTKTEEADSDESVPCQKRSRRQAPSVEGWRERIQLEMRAERNTRPITVEEKIRHQAIDQQIGLRVISYAESCEVTMSSYFCLNYKEYHHERKAHGFFHQIKEHVPDVDIRILGPTLEDFQALNSEIKCDNFQAKTVSAGLTPELQAATPLHKITQIIQRTLIQAVRRVLSIDNSFILDCPESTIVACSPQMTYRLTNPKILSFENMDPSLMKKIATKIADASKILSDPKQVAALVTDDSPVSHHLRSNVYSKNFS